LIKEDLLLRKVKTSILPDKLKWRYQAFGGYSVKESNFLKSQHASLLKEDIWNRIWGVNLWPKVATLLWLVAHGKILTWDNLLSRGFSREIFCNMCGKDNKTVENLLNQCNFIQGLWDQGEISFQHSDRKVDSPNSARESIFDRNWSMDEMDHYEREHLILSNLIHPSSLPSATLSKTSSSSISIPYFWSPPPSRFIKLNFDGASKGNIRPVRFGGVFRYDLG
jgi:hypothetical protein